MNESLYNVAWNCCETHQQPPASFGNYGTPRKQLWGRSIQGGKINWRAEKRTLTSFHFPNFHQQSAQLWRLIMSLRHSYCSAEVWEHKHTYWFPCSLVQGTWHLSVKQRPKTLHTWGLSADCESAVALWRFGSFSVLSNGQRIRPCKNSLVMSLKCM